MYNLTIKERFQTGVLYNLNCTNVQLKLAFCTNIIEIYIEIKKEIYIKKTYLKVGKRKNFLLTTPQNILMLFRVKRTRNDFKTILAAFGCSGDYLIKNETKVSRIEEKRANLRF